MNINIFTALHLATVGGARVVKMEDAIGKFEVT